MEKPDKGMAKNILRVLWEGHYNDARRDIALIEDLLHVVAYLDARVRKLERR